MGDRSRTHEHHHNQGRGHGRSSQPWHGNDLDTYADDLAELVQQLDLKDEVNEDLLGFVKG